MLFLKVCLHDRTVLVNTSEHYSTCGRALTQGKITPEVYCYKMANTSRTDRSHGATQMPLVSILLSATQMMSL